MKYGFIYVTDPKWEQKLPDLPGVYWLLAMQATMETCRDLFLPMEIPRLFRGPDRFGILYIGGTPRSGTIRSRAGHGLISLLHSLTEHSCWEAFKGRNPLFDYFHTPGLADYISIANMALAYETTNDSVDASRTEQRRYYNYRQQFGERPPFNRDFTMTHYESECVGGWKKHKGPLKMEDARWGPDFLRIGETLLTS